jgi:hypothetical protein
MDREFIADIETWGSGDQMLDIVTFKDGKVLVISDAAMVLYESRRAFEAGTNGRLLYQSGSEPLP